MPTEFDVFVNPFRGVGQTFLRGFERGLSISETQRREKIREKERKEDISRRGKERAEDIERRGFERAEDIEAREERREEDIEYRESRAEATKSYRESQAGRDQQKIEIAKERLELDRIKAYNATLSKEQQRKRALFKASIDYRKNYYTYALNEFDIKNHLEKYSISKSRMETIYNESRRDYQRMKELREGSAEEGATLFPVMIDMQKDRNGKTIPVYLTDPKTGQPQEFEKEIVDNFYRSEIPSQSYHPVFSQKDYGVPGAMNYNYLSSEIDKGHKAFSINKIKQTTIRDAFINQHGIDPDLVKGPTAGVHSGRFQDIIKITDRYQFDFLFSKKQQRDIAEEMRDNPGLLRQLRRTVQAEKATSGRDREWLFWRLAYELAQLNNPSLPKVPYEMLGKGRIQSIDELKGTYNQPLEVSLPPIPVRQPSHREIEAPRVERRDDEVPVSEIAKPGSKLEGMILEHRKVKRMQEAQERRGYGRRLEWWEMVSKPKKKKK